MSLVLGRVLFGEQLTLGVRAVPAAAGAALVAAGVVELARSTALESPWDTRKDAQVRAGRS
jgi:hypothetical protein